MKLNPKQRAFVREYLVDHNATAAAKRAGYSARTAASQGWDLLQKPEIRAALEKKEQTLDERCGITPERILRETAAIAFADLKKDRHVRAADKLRANETLGARLELFKAKVEVAADQNLAELIARSYSRKDDPDPGPEGAE